MEFSDLIVLAVILLIVGGALFYVIRQKKKGVHCIGCPDAKTCSAAKGGCCHCEPTKKNKEQTEE